MKKQFVLDTNVLLSAILRTGDVSKKALAKARLEGEIFFSEATFDELIDVINRPKLQKYIDPEIKDAFIKNTLNKFDILKVEPSITACRDPKDNKFLDLIVEIKADMLISGDKDLLVLHPFQSIPIITPSEFLSKNL
jgi:uncharacterized protein